MNITKLKKECEEKFTKLQEQYQTLQGQLNQTADALKECKGEYQAYTKLEKDDEHKKKGAK